MPPGGNEPSELKLACPLKTEISSFVAEINKTTVICVWM